MECGDGCLILLGKQYTILDQSWQQWLEGLQIVHDPDGTSRLAGLLPDQPALQGVLHKINRLRFPLLSLETSEAPGRKGGAEPS